MNTVHQPPGAGSRKSTVRELGLPIQSDTTDADLLGIVMGYYTRTLLSAPPAQQYLLRRSIAAEGVIDHFKLGFADRTLGLRLPFKNRKLGKDVRTRLTNLGIFRDTGHEQFRGSLIIPVFNSAGEIVQAYGRKITEGLHANLPDHTYLNVEGRGVWHEQGLEGNREAILCQSLIDGLTFWCNGYHNVTAIFGPGGFTSDYLDAFRRHGTARIYIAFRNNPAGDEAASGVAAQLTQAGIESFRVKFEPGMDANEHLLHNKTSVPVLTTTIEQAEKIHPGANAAVPLPAVPEEPPALATPPRPPARRPRLALVPPAKPAAPSAPIPVPQPPPAPTMAAEAPTTPSPVTTAPVPVAPAAESVTEAEMLLTFGDRRYRVRGLDRLDKGAAFSSLKLNILLSRPENPGVFHVDTFDLYMAKQRTAFMKQAAIELGLTEEIIRHDLGRVLLAVEAEQVRRRAAIEAKPAIPLMTEKEAEAALALLKDPHLLDRILADFDRAGVVGERENLLFGYLAATSRKLDDPLAVIIQSTSAAGKTSLMDAILAMLPEEDRHQYSSMTGQALYYLGAGDLRHKVLAIAEEEGAERASYALKLLQSEGELTIASTGKDGASGRLVTETYKVEGPVALFLTTTAVDVDAELLNRCVVLTVDEGREQTRAIHILQRERQTLEGQLAVADRDEIMTLHRNAQRLLRPVLVVNPHARELTFLDDRTRTRRDHGKYLTLIRTVALLHQRQRPTKTVERNGKAVEYIEVEPADIAVANRLADHVLGQSLDDLPPHTRRLLTLLDVMVTTECERTAVQRSDFRFTRKQGRERTGWGETQLKVHLARLVELEHVLVTRTPGGGHVYELAYDGRGADGQPFLPGLLDPAKLGQPGLNGVQSGAGWPPVGGKPGGSRGAQTDTEHTNSRGMVTPAAGSAPQGTPGGSQIAGPRQTRSDRKGGTP